jgi:uncharacterized repeat protein (TIGR02543 family)
MNGGNKMNKRIISLLLSLVMILGLVLSPGITANAWAGTMGSLNGNDVTEASVGNPFTDVPEDSFYCVPVLWALENGITTGATATTFNPNGVCQRAAVATFLWRAAGNPEPNTADNPFVDVKESDFFYKAVLWAVEKGITNGSDATHFNPYGVCNRAQVVTFLHRAKGSPAPSNADLPFTDVPTGAWYAVPVAWAVENGITNGLSATGFGPNAACNRAQVVTFLYRAYSVKAPVCAHVGLRAVEAKTPTCTEPGNITYWYCADCGKYFDDSEAGSEIACADTIIAATGHTLGADASCTEDQICTVCGRVIATANGHIPGVEATCTEPQRCMVCQIVLAEATGHSLTYVEERDPVSKDDPGNRAYWQCTICGKCYLDEAATKEIAIENTAWEIFKVTYYCDENKMKQVVWYKVGFEVEELPEPVIDGYQFNYWKDGNGKRINYISAENTENLELYADVTIEEYTIYLGGTWNYDNISYNITKRVDLPIPYEDGLTFAGWRDAEGKVVESTDSVGVKRWYIPAGTTGDIALMAQWKDNRNLVVPDTESAEDRYIDGGYDENAGYYWFVYSLGEIRNVVLDEESKLIKTDHAGGHISGSLTLAETKTVEKSVAESFGSSVCHAVVTSTNWEQVKGWQETDTGRTGCTITVGAEAGPEFAKVKTEVAVGLEYEKSASVSEDFSVGGGTEESDEKTYTMENNISYSESLSLTTERTMNLAHDVAPGNYYFANIGTVKVYAFVVFDPVTNTIGLETYSILEKETSTTVLSDKKDDREYVSDPLVYDVHIDGINSTLNSHYFVQYLANNGVTDEDGVLESLLKMYPRDTEVQLEGANLFDYTGYSFDKWVTVLGDEYEAGKTVSNLADPGKMIVLNAHWNAHKYTIEYHANKPGHASANVQNMPADAVCRYDTSVTLGEAPALTGWTFGGWYLDAACTEKLGDAGAVIEKANLTTEPNGEVTLYARWTPNSYAVTYDANGGTVEPAWESKVFDQAYGPLPVPVRVNCTFGGWYLNSEPITDATFVTRPEDHTLTAHWSIPTAGSWESDDRDKKITESGWTEYWQTGLNREALRELGHTEIVLTVKIAGHFLGNDWFKADWFFDLYDRLDKKLLTEKESAWSNSWSSRTFTYTLGIDAIRDDGTIKVRYDHEGDSWDDWGLGQVTVTTAVK